MPEVPEASFVSREQIASLASLYDSFYHSLDDQSAAADAAERQFFDELSKLWEGLREKHPSLTHDRFRRKVIEECRRHLRATNRLPSV